MHAELEIRGNVERSVVQQGDYNTSNTYNFYNVTLQELSPEQRRAANAPIFHFDRARQKAALRPFIVTDVPVLLPIYGSAGEGHARLVEFYFHELRPTPHTKRVRVRTWPRAARPEALLGELCE